MPETLLTDVPVTRAKPRGKLRLALLASDPHCAYCGCEVSVKNSGLSRLVPISRGGGNNPENQVLACQRCVSAKEHRTLPEWLTELRAISERVTELIGKAV